MRARISVFLPILWIKDLGAIGKGRVILFVHEHTLQVLLVFFLHFHSDNKAILQNL